MIWVLSKVTCLNPLHVVAQVGFIEVHALHEASSLVQVDSQQGQTVPWCLLSKAENIKLPVAFSVLQAHPKQFPGGTSQSLYARIKHAAAQAAGAGLHQDSIKCALHHVNLSKGHKVGSCFYSLAEAQPHGRGVYRWSNTCKPTPAATSSRACRL